MKLILFGEKKVIKSKPIGGGFFVFIVFDSAVFLFPFISLCVLGQFHIMEVEGPLGISNGFLVFLDVSEDVGSFGQKRGFFCS